MATNQKALASKQIQTLMPRHYKILDLAILGLNPVDIAKELKMTSGQVRIIMKAPCFQHQFGLRRSMHEEKVSEEAVVNLDQTRETLTRSATLAAEALVGGLSSGDERIKIKSAESILDRTGYPKETKIEGGNNTIIAIDNKQLNLMNDTLKMLANKTKVEEFKVTGQTPDSS
jgi:hypothetical protein